MTLEYCSPGEEGTAFFMAAFTMRLPPTIQAHLASTELTNLKELAQMAACLWLCHAPQTVATLQVKEDQQKEDSSDVVTAMAAKKWPTLKGSPRDSRPLEKTARARAAAGCIRSMEKTATDVPTRRTAPGWETRWRGGGGRYLLWPQRLTSPVGGRSITAAKCMWQWVAGGIRGTFS